MHFRKFMLLNHTIEAGVFGKSTPAIQEELNMEKDIGWKLYFADNERYADIINGIGCGGNQLIKDTDLSEDDTQAGKKTRDLLRKSAFGVNFAMIGIENQEKMDYSLPLRIMNYDVWKYERQAAQIRKEVRKNIKERSVGEYLYGFGKDCRLHPVITFVLYSGKEEWDGPVSLHEMLDFTDVPESLCELTSNYKLNVIEIRRFEHTEVFKTDVRQVFEFIKCSEDKKALRKLVESDNYYRNMQEDAYDVVAMYTNSTELLAPREYRRKDGKVDMCKAIRDMMEDSRAEGIETGREEGADFFAALTQHLIMDARMDDLLRATSDKEYRNLLYGEYGMEQQQRGN